MTWLCEPSGPENEQPGLALRGHQRAAEFARRVDGHFAEAAAGPFGHRPVFAAAQIEAKRLSLRGGEVDVGSGDMAGEWRQAAQVGEPPNRTRLQFDAKQIVFSRAVGGERILAQGVASPASRV